MTNQHPPHVSGTISLARVEALIRHAELLASTLIDGGEFDALRRHHLDTASALRILAAIQPDPQPVASEPVAIIGDGYRLLWASPATMTEIVDNTGIKIGSYLYAHPATPSSAPASVAEAAALSEESK